MTAGSKAIAVTQCCGGLEVRGKGAGHLECVFGVECLKLRRLCSGEEADCSVEGGLFSFRGPDWGRHKYYGSVLVTSVGQVGGRCRRTCAEHNNGSRFDELREFGFEKETMVCQRRGTGGLLYYGVMAASPPKETSSHPVQCCAEAAPSSPPAAFLHSPRRVRTSPPPRGTATLENLQC